MADGTTSDDLQEAADSARDGAAAQNEQADQLDEAADATRDVESE